MYVRAFYMYTILLFFVYEKEMFNTNLITYAVFEYHNS